MTTIPLLVQRVAVTLDEEEWHVVVYVLLHSAVMPALPSMNYARLEAIGAAIDAQCSATTPLPPCPRMGLVSARRARRMSQHNLADIFDVAMGTVGRWERGVAMPTPYHLRKLCALFGMSEQELGFD